MLIFFSLRPLRPLRLCVSASLRPLRLFMIDHNTQETLLLDLSITLSRKNRRPLMKNAEHAEAQRTQRENERRQIY